MNYLKIMNRQYFFLFSRVKILYERSTVKMKGKNKGHAYDFNFLFHRGISRQKCRVPGKINECAIEKASIGVYIYMGAFRSSSSV